MRRPALHGFVSATLAALASTGVAQLPQPEFEVVCREGPDSQLLRYGEYTSGCSIEDPEDTDAFHFFGAAGDRVLLRARTVTSGLDLRIQTFGPGGVLVEDRSGASISIPLTLTESGTWSLLVSDNAQDGFGDYMLQVERIPRGPGDGIPTLPWDVEISDSIWRPTDLDFLKIEGRAGTRLDLMVRSVAPGLDLQVELIDPTGDTVWSQFCIGGTQISPRPCAFTMSLPFFMDGTHFIKISDVGVDEMGGYLLTLDCSFNPQGCPPDPGLLGLTVDQPGGPGSLRIVNQSGIPGDIYITTFSTSELNDTLPGHGWWGGLHINFLNLFNQALAGPPFAGVLNTVGLSRFQLPAGSLPPLPPGFRMHWVTRTLGPSLQTITETSNVVSITLQ